MSDAASLDIEIRRLRPEDAGAYVVLRRAMVEAEPFAFLGAPGDDDSPDAAVVEGRLRQSTNAIFCGVDPVDPSRLVASAGVYREPRAKTRHRATVWGVYVDAAFRGRGLGARVVGAAVECVRAWEGVELVQLSVSARLPGARRLYERLGFVAWGVEPNAMIVDGERVSEVFMQLDLAGG